MKSKISMRTLCAAVALSAIVLSTLSVADITGQWAHWRTSSGLYEEMVLMNVNPNAQYPNYGFNAYPLVALGSTYIAPGQIKVTIGAKDYVEDSLEVGPGMCQYGTSQFFCIYALAELDAPNYGDGAYYDRNYNLLMPYVTLQTESELTCPSSSYTSGINNQQYTAGETAQAYVAIPYCPLDGGFPVYAYGFFIHGI